MVQPAVTQADYAAYVAAGVALLTAIGSFVASWFSNRNSRAQQKTQLQHASDQLKVQLQHTADQRDRDRAMALRRDVYLPAVEAIIRSHGSLGKVINLEADLAEIGQQMITDQATMAKIHLVGSQRTVTALMTYINELMPGYMELMSLRVPMAVRRQAIDAEQSLMDRSNAMQQQIVELMRQFNIAGKTDQDEWQRLNRQVEAEKATFSQHADKKAELWTEQLAELRRAFIRMNELAIRLTSLIPDAVIAARQEIELPIDPEEYRRLFAEQNQVVQRVMQDFLNRTLPPQAQRPPPLSDA
jgi:hypothetical protein